MLCNLPEVGWEFDCPSAERELALLVVESEFHRRSPCNCQLPSLTVGVGIHLAERLKNLEKVNVIVSIDRGDLYRIPGLRSKYRMPSCVSELNRALGKETDAKQQKKY